jgi:hypothetical protein
VATRRDTSDNLVYLQIRGSAIPQGHWFRYTFQFLAAPTQKLKISIDPEGTAPGPSVSNSVDLASMPDRVRFGFRIRRSSDADVQKLTYSVDSITIVRN